MKKVIFCEVAWMKNYCGVTEDDKPSNGGKYIDENGYGGEVCNFLPYNHKCYGYVMHYGDQLHIERYEKVTKNHSEVTDMTVVWVASNGTRSMIVGWYEHATVYREWQTLQNPEWEQSFDYNFLADEKDCYLIPEEKRTFVIPRAPISGKGRGMGQSQVWYADSEYAQEEFVPEVLEYLNDIRRDCPPMYLTKEEIQAVAEDEGLTVEELTERGIECYQQGDFKKAFQYANLAVAKADTYETRYLRADLYALMYYYDEAEEELKMALYHKSDDIESMAYLMFVELMLEKNYLAIDLGEKLRQRRTEVPGWASVAANLVQVYLNEGEIGKAQEILEECQQEKDLYQLEFIDDAKERIDKMLQQ